jgi:uncharacterized protein (TIGR02145 family)
MKLRAWLVQGRGLLLAAVIVVAVCMFGCGEDDGEGGTGNNPGNNGGGNADYVTIGGKKWMNKNLNVQTADSWCYDNDPANCAKYGRLYSWSAAQAVCPTGWHLPSYEEWVDLATTVGGFDVAGKKLKAKNGWDEYGNGTDDYGFSALPGGTADTFDEDWDFYGAGKCAAWWISSGGTYTDVSRDGEVYTFEFSGGLFEMCYRGDGADIDGGREEDMTGAYLSVRCASGE